MKLLGSEQLFSFFVKCIRTLKNAIKNDGLNEISENHSYGKEDYKIDIKKKIIALGEGVKNVYLSVVSTIRERPLFKLLHIKGIFRKNK